MALSDSLEWPEDDRALLCWGCLSRSLTEALDELDALSLPNGGANKLNEAVRRADDNHRQMMAVAESGRTWQATADAHLATIRDMREALRNAVNLSCSCGGRPDDAPDGCPACTVWHMMANTVHEPHREDGRE